MPTQKKALKKPKPKTNSILPKGGMSPKAGISPNISTIPQDILLHLWTFKMPILVFIILVFSYLIFLNIFGLSIICSI
jgi:hypothetical protein